MQVWFSRDGRWAFVVSQKASALEIVETNFDTDGFSRPKRRAVIDIKAQDPFGFTPFEKTSPDGQELWPDRKMISFDRLFPNGSAATLQFAFAAFAAASYSGVPLSGIVQK